MPNMDSVQQIDVLIPHSSGETLVVLVDWRLDGAHVDVHSESHGRTTGGLYPALSLTEQAEAESRARRLLYKLLEV